MARRPRLRVIIPVLLVGLVGVFAVVGVLSGRRSSSGLMKTADRSAMSASSAGLPEVPTPAKAAASGYGAAAGSDVALAAPPASAYSAHRLLRTGDLSLLVARGTLLSTVDRITSMTNAAGGYVMSSAVGSDSGTPVPLSGQATTSGTAAPVDSQSQPPTTSSGGSPYTTLTVRVPESHFDAVIRQFAALGEVQSVSTSSEDVTSQYVDLQARLTHYRAVEDRLVRFLAATANVNQMLAVQDRIDRVQLTIEQLSAQLKSLHETTTYGTLSIFVREKGATGTHAAGSSGTFTGTLWHSITLLGRGARATGLFVTALLPFAVVLGAIGLVAWYVTRRLRRSRRQPAQPSLPA